MIGKGKSITHTQAAINYALVKEKAEVIDKRFLAGESPEEMTKEFQQFQNLNGRCKNNTFSFVISPSIEDGKKLTNQDYQKIAREFLDKSGLKDHQAIVMKHKDREHTHLHIFANRIGMNGEAAKDHFIGKQSQRIAEEIAQKRGLTIARHVQIEREEERKPVKEEIKGRFENAIKTAKPRNLEEFWDALRANKIEVNPTINKAGKMQGYRVAFGGQDFKASEIGNKYTIGKIDKTLQKENQKQEQQQYKPKFKGPRR